MGKEENDENSIPRKLESDTAEYLQQILQRLDKVFYYGRNDYIIVFNSKIIRRPIPLMSKSRVFLLRMYSLN